MSLRVDEIDCCVDRQAVTTSSAPPSVNRTLVHLADAMIAAEQGMLGLDRPGMCGAGPHAEPAEDVQPHQEQRHPAEHQSEPSRRPVSSMLRGIAQASSATCRPDRPSPPPVTLP